jgi:sedoheptulokinase
MEHFAGLDIGTSKVSAVVLDAEGGLAAAAARPNDAGMEGLPPGRDEQSPARIHEIALGLLADLTDSVGAVRALGLTGQMHGVLVADSDLQPLTNLITWRDRRAEERTPDGRTYLEELGFGAAGYGAATLYHLRRTGGLPGRARHVLLIQDWLAAKLAGCAPCTDPTDAASTGLYDVQARRWDAERCEAAGVPPDLLPPVQEAGTPLGRLSSGATSHTPLGDNQASVLASFSDPAAQVLVNIGTGGQVSAVTDRFLRGPDMDARPFPGGRLLSVGASLCGGAAFSYLGEHYARAVRSITGEDVPVDRILSALAGLAAEVGAGAGGLRLDPLLEGKRSDPSLRGALAGMTAANNTPGHWARAFIEGLVAELAGYYAQMLASGLGPRCRLVGSGNGMRLNPVMRQAAGAAFGMPVALPAWREEAACGAALCAMVGCGALGSFEDAAALVRYEEA